MVNRRRLVTGRLAIALVGQVVACRPGSAPAYLTPSLVRVKAEGRLAIAARALVGAVGWPQSARKTC